MERSLKWIRRAIVGLFAALTLWMAYWSVIAAPGLVSHPRNPRSLRADSQILRGGIYARGEEALSVTAGEGAGFVRRFVGPKSLAHVVGYSDPRYGRSGLEAALNEYLTGAAGLGLTGRMRAALSWPRRGWDVVTTVDARLQEAAASAMAGRTGALVAMDPASGAIYALVSEPGFDPGRIGEYLAGAGGAGANLFNRATQGQYPPGSAFKPVVMAAALEAGTIEPSALFWDAGSVRVGERTIRNAGGAAYGTVALDDALALSSNVVFARLAAAMTASDLFASARRLGLGERPGIEIAAASGRLPGVGELADAVLRAEVGIGQGTLLVTPLQMAVVASAVANGGYRVEPTLVASLRLPGGGVRGLPRAAPVRAISSGTAAVVKEAMVAAAQRGTARAVWPEGKAAAGKTGTAENPHGEPHAWFIGFYPAAEPKIALAVVVENGGPGSAAAVPIARAVFAEWERLAKSERTGSLP